MVWGMHRMRATRAKNGIPRATHRSSRESIIVSLLVALSQLIANTYNKWRCGYNCMPIQNMDRYPSNKSVDFKGFPYSTRKVGTRVFANQVTEIDEQFLCAATFSTACCIQNKAQKRLTKLPIGIYVVHNYRKEGVAIARSPRIKRQTDHALDPLLKLLLMSGNDGGRECGDDLPE